MSTPASRPKLRPTGWDALVFGTVAALAVLSAVWYYGNLSSTGPLTAVITHRGREVERIVLSELTEERTLELEGDWQLTLRLSPEGVWVESSTCPGQDCLHTGRISQAGQSIVCLPEKVTVLLTGGSGGPDAVLG